MNYFIGNKCNGIKVTDLKNLEIELVIVKKFGEDLTKGLLTWYSLFPENLIRSFAELVDAFIKAHTGAQKVEKCMEDIFMTQLGGTELLRDFMYQFQKERMLMLDYLLCYHYYGIPIIFALSKDQLNLV